MVHLSDPGDEVDGGAVHARVGHLGGDRAVPYEAVESQFLPVQQSFDALRCPRDSGGANGFVRLLRQLGLRAVAPGPLMVVVAEGSSDVAARFTQRLLGERHGVGSHVGDQPLAVAAAEVDAFVQPLCDPHRLARGHAQTPARRLLQRRGGEGRRRTLPGGLPVDRVDSPRNRAHGPGCDPVGGLPVEHDRASFRERLPGDRVEVPGGRDPAPTDTREHRREFEVARRQRRTRTPVLGHPKAQAFLFTVHHQPQRDALHPARAQLGAHLLPEDGGQAVAEEPVQHAARLLRPDQSPVHLAGVGERLADGGAGDLVEGDPPYGHPRFEHLHQVPADRFALAVLIGREEDLVRALEQPVQLAHISAALLGDDVDGSEPIRRVHGQPAPGLVPHGGRDLAGGPGQVTDVAVGGRDPVLRPEEPLDGLRLRGRLDDHQLH